MHVDNNTRGSNQTAMRTLDPGGGLLICKAILFRTSLVWLCGQLVVPWGLDSMVFRFMRWDHEGAATIEELPVVAFYALVEDYREANYGNLDVCLLDLKGGVAMASPNHTVGEATALPSVASDLMPVSFDQLVAQAQAATPLHPSPLWEAVGFNQEWAVFYGWKYAHCWIGDPWIRRYHLFGCALRNVPMGQVRHVSKDLAHQLGPYEPPTLRHAKQDCPPLAKRPRHPPKTPKNNSHAPLSPYELERLYNIEKNEQKLRELGILV